MAESRTAKRNARASLTSNSSDDQETGADRIANYCCFLRNFGTGTYGSGFIVEFKGLKREKLLALDWEERRKLKENPKKRRKREKREKTGKLQTDYALITSHDTIPGLSPLDLKDWKFSCQGIKNGNEQTLVDLVCGVISCCGPESLFGPDTSKRKYSAHTARMQVVV